MKEMTKYSRVAAYLEKLFDMLNADLFNSELERPIITLIPSSRSYGHYVPTPIWSIKDEHRRELNIATGTLNRPIEDTIGTLVHEMCHIYNNEVLNIQDASRGGTYHNKRFRDTAQAHGLNVTRSDKYGYSHTSPSDSLIEWCIERGLREIDISRMDIERGTGSGTRAIGGNGTAKVTVSHNHRFVCPSCGTVARAGRRISLATYSKSSAAPAELISF